MCIRDRLVLQSKNMMQAAIARQGNSYAATRVRSYGSVGGAYDEVMGGISYYRFLSGICESIDRDFDAIKEKLTAVAREMTLENLTVGITGGASAAESFIAAAPEFGTGTGSGKHYTLEPAYRGNEAFVIPSAVNYVAKGFNCIKAGIPYDPKMGVLSRILRFDWLWNEVRVRGGAYGVSFGVSRSGDAVFSSYRDPSVGKTVGVYDGTVGYLRDFAAKNPDITKYIISTAAGYERPLTPRELGAAAQSNYFEGIKSYPPEEALDSALALVNNVSKKRLLSHIEEMILRLDQMEFAEPDSLKDNPFAKQLMEETRLSASKIEAFKGIYTSYSLSSSSDCLKMEPFLLSPSDNQVRVGRISAYGEAQWGFGIMPDPQNFHCMLNENQAPQFTMVTIYLQIPFFKNPRQLRGLYIGQDYNRNPIARRILLIKESESTEIDEFMSRKSGLIDKEDFTPEQQVYYDYTCQTGDFIKMCTVPSLRMDESDLVKEKKMLTL